MRGLWVDFGKDKDDGVAGIPQRLLQVLPHLTRLELECALSAAALQHLGALSKLQHLVLIAAEQQNRGNKPLVFAGVNLGELSHLTHLELACSSSNESGLKLQHLGSLTKLQHLALCALDAAAGTCLKELNCCRASLPCSWGGWEQTPLLSTAGLCRAWIS